MKGTFSWAQLKWALLLGVALPMAGNAQEYLMFDDFESPQGLSTGNQWQWQAAYGAGNLNGMMFGEGDIYSIQQFGRANSGQHVLQLRFDGRNGFCNACSSASHNLTGSEAASGCFNINGAPWGDSVYNKNNGFSRWEITSATNSQVCMDTDAPIGESMWGNSNLSSGNQLRVPRRCGVNGTVGNNPDRRSDCNQAINYLRGVNRNDLRPGETLAHRFYFYIPAETVMPSIGLKLGYTRFARASGGTTNVIVTISVQRNFSVFAQGEAIFDFTPANMNIRRNTWYYMEEVFTRETSAGGSNGTYQLYLGEADDPNPNQPVVTRTGLTLGEIDGISVIGNWQHFNDAAGSLYIDDVAIAKRRVGPTDQQPRPEPIAWQ